MQKRWAKILLIFAPLTILPSELLGYRRPEFVSPHHDQRTRIDLDCEIPIFRKRPYCGLDLNGALPIAPINLFFHWRIHLFNPQKGLTCGNLLDLGLGHRWNIRNQRLIGLGIHGHFSLNKDFCTGCDISIDLLQPNFQLAFASHLSNKPIPELPYLKHSDRNRFRLCFAPPRFLIGESATHALRSRECIGILDGQMARGPQGGNHTFFMGLQGYIMKIGRWRFNLRLCWNLASLGCFKSHEAREVFRIHLLLHDRKPSIYRWESASSMARIASEGFLQTETIIRQDRTTISLPSVHSEPQDCRPNALEVLETGLRQRFATDFDEDSEDSGPAVVMNTTRAVASMDVNPVQDGMTVSFSERSHADLQGCFNPDRLSRLQGVSSSRALTDSDDTDSWASTSETMSEPSSMGLNHVQDGITAPLASSDLDPKDRLVFRILEAALQVMFLTDADEDSDGLASTREGTSALSPIGFNRTLTRCNKIANIDLDDPVRFASHRKDLDEDVLTCSIEHITEEVPILRGDQRPGSGLQMANVAMRQREVSKPFPLHDEPTRWFWSNPALSTDRRREYLIALAGWRQRVLPGLLASPLVIHCREAFHCQPSPIKLCLPVLLPQPHVAIVPPFGGVPHRHGGVGDSVKQWEDGQTAARSHFCGRSCWVCTK